MFKIQDSRFKIQDSRFKIQDSRFKIQGLLVTTFDVATHIMRVKSNQMTKATRYKDCSELSFHHFINISSEDPAGSEMLKESLPHESVMPSEGLRGEGCTCKEIRIAASITMFMGSQGKVDEHACACPAMNILASSQQRYSSARQVLHYRPSSDPP